MDDLSLALNISGIGGYLGDAFLNHLCYADDIPVKKPCTDSIREVVGYVWIRTDPHITGTIFARINPRGFHTCTP